MSAGKAVAELTPRVHLLLNVAGILGDGNKMPGPERSILGIDREWLQQTLDVNLVGHIMVTQALLPLHHIQDRRAARVPRLCWRTAMAHGDRSRPREGHEAHQEHLWAKGATARQAPGPMGAG